MERFPHYDTCVLVRDSVGLELLVLERNSWEKVRTGKLKYLRDPGTSEALLLLPAALFGLRSSSKTIYIKNPVYGTWWYSQEDKKWEEQIKSITEIVAFVIGTLGLNFFSSIASGDNGVD